MSHFCVYISKTIVIKEIEKVENGENLNSNLVCYGERDHMGRREEHL